APAAEPQWLAAAADAAEIKRVLLQQATGRLSPKDLAEQCRRVVAAREIAATVRTIEAIGATVRYRSVDVRDAAAVRELVEQTTAELGPVTALVHGAGVLADKHFVDKSDDDFDRVYGTKVEGAHNLLAALSDAPLRAIVMFSSSTARFGRRGQSDYAMANEVLNKLAQRLRFDRPGVRTVSVGWGPWDGGMVTPALAAIFRDEGVGTIGLEDGATLLVNELAGGGPAEIIVVGGGTRFEASADSAPTEPQVSPERPTVFERELSVADHPFLASHVLGGKAVLPTVMMLEWLAHAALAEHPGLRFVGVDDLRIFKGIRLGASDRLKVRVEAGPSAKRDGQFVVPVALCSGGTNGHRVVHAQGEVVLANQADVAPQADLPSLPAFEEPVESVYAQRLFHGEAFRGIETIEGLAADGIVATTRAAPSPKEWMSAPVRRHWITDPLAVDSGLQAVIVWTSAQAGAASLPNRLGRYRQFAAFPAQGARVGVRVTRRGDHRAVADLDWVDDSGRLIARLTDCEYTLDAGLSAAFVRNRVE
ncbi:MAG: SDR family NAD(P)-dependent oxidoreductase, partial [Nannocystaceae bacterium]|nr:SDR family NAD(P)-dependent oxidoreductase [Nannocystaceae bacterium]